MKKPETARTKPTVNVHVYCFDCKSDLRNEVQLDKKDVCPSCGSVRVAHDPEEGQE